MFLEFKIKCSKTKNMSPGVIGDLIIEGNNTVQTFKCIGLNGENSGVSAIDINLWDKGGNWNSKSLTL